MGGAFVYQKWPNSIGPLVNFIFPTIKSGGGGWHKASVSDCLPLAAPIGLSPLLILTLCGPERVLVVSAEPPDDLSCLTTPGSAVPETGCCPCQELGGGSRWGYPPPPPVVVNRFRTSLKRQLLQGILILILI